MWIRASRFWSLIETLAVFKERVLTLTARLAAMQATQDWLTAHVNRLENERRILTEARLGLMMPMPTIERQEPPGVETPPGLDPGSVHGTPDESIPLAQMLASSMDDMGDDAAGRMGIAHDAQGMLVYKRVGGSDGHDPDDADRVFSDRQW